MKNKYITFFTFCVMTLSLLFTSCQARNSSWKPSGNEPWNYTAEPDVLRIHDVYDYDLDISLDQSLFSQAPQTIYCTISNKTDCGVNFRKIYIEKYYNHIEGFGANGYVEEFVVGGWVRIPFIMDGYWFDRSDNGRSVQGEIDLYKYLLADYEYTSGDYRIVFPLTDATHYAYFHIQNNN